MREDLMKNLTDEQKKQVKACKSPDEILQLAQKEGYELSDEQLEAIGGGGCVSGHSKMKCPFCNSTDIHKYKDDRPEYKCDHCWKIWIP